MRADLHNYDYKFEGTNLTSLYINCTTNGLHICSDDYTYVYIIFPKNMNVSVLRNIDVILPRNIIVSVLSNTGVTFPNNINSVIKLLRPQL